MEESASSKRDEKNPCDDSQRCHRRTLTSGVIPEHWRKRGVEARLAFVDTRRVVEYRIARSWLWYIRVGLLVTLVGGLAMLVVAGAAHDSASIPLAVIGGGWLLCGIGGLYQRGKLVRAVQLEGGVVTFTLLNGGEMIVPAAKIVEVRRARFDPNRFAPLQIRTNSGDSLRVPAQLRGLLDLLLQLRLLNPNLDTTHT